MNAQFSVVTRGKYSGVTQYALITETMSISFTLTVSNIGAVVCATKVIIQNINEVSERPNFFHQ